MAEFALATPEVLSREHRTESFDCGKAPLNEWLQKHALANASGGSARTFVVADAEKVVVGYYSLAAISLAPQAAPDRLAKGQPRHPIPAVLMARFAVDASQQGRGLGRALLRDALLRSLRITDDLGARAFVTDAKDEEAARFYRKFGFAQFPNSNRLYLLFKDVKKLLF